MSNGFCHWYERDRTRERAAELIGRLASAGIGTLFDQVRVATATTRAFVVDLRGESGGEDWDEPVAGTAGRFAIRPDVTILPADISALHPQPHAGPARRLGELVVFDERGLLPT